jgi:hypothetical protein
VQVNNSTNINSRLTTTSHLKSVNINKTTTDDLGWGQTIYSLHMFYVIQILIRYMLKIKVKQFLKDGLCNRGQQL